MARLVAEETSICKQCGVIQRARVVVETSIRNPRYEYSLESKVGRISGRKIGSGLLNLIS